MNFRLFFFATISALSLPAALPEAQERAIAEIVETALSASGTPAASVAIVQEGRVAYTRAFGKARVAPDSPATPEMRFKIASNSKQFVATAILLLAEDGKLSLSDKVSKYLPELTRAGEITIRQLLSHTSGYRDYYPLDYVAPFMTRNTTAEDVLTKWAKIPLDFEPGTRWQYSNTNYIVAGRILEKVARVPLMDFLRARILDKLGMRSAIDVATATWSGKEPAGYLRYATGPLRAAPPETGNWTWAAGQLAMSASDLARWDISLIEGSLLKPASLRALTTEVQLAGGTGTHYALGLDVTALPNGHRRWAHGGGLSGFVSYNITFPDDRMAITVLTNCDAAPAAAIAQKLQELLLAPVADPQAAPSLERAKQLYEGLSEGRAEAALISSDLAAYFTPQAVADFAAALKSAGAPVSFTETSHQNRGGMMHRAYSVRTATRAFRISAFVEPDGRFSQFLISAAP